ncbi:MAG: type IIL restriction-modification enzyme MmeI [Anaerolineales bacterium]
MGSTLEDRPSYSSSRIFETLPFPWAPSKEPKDDPRVKAIAQATKDLVEQRERRLNAEGLSEAEKKKRTLTNLYNQRPTWLDLAHKQLDEAVCAAYGWQSDLSDEEILEGLLALNLERARQNV